jgi:hypothetical protein
MGLISRTSAHPLRAGDTSIVGPLAYAFNEPRNVWTWTQGPHSAVWTSIPVSRATHVFNQPRNMWTCPQSPHTAVSKSPCQFPLIQ